MCLVNNYGDPKRQCRCAFLQVQRYRKRISGPLLDRIDIHLEVGAVTYHEMAGKEIGESSAAMRERVGRAREIRRERFGTKGKVRCNARMSPKQIKTSASSTRQGWEQWAS